MRIAAAIVLFSALVWAQDKIAPGTYKGTWNGATANGDFHLTVRPDGKSADVGFSMGGEEVACKVVSVKIEGAAIEIVYQFDLQGNSLQSAIKGSLKGKSLEGTYRTTAGDSPVDEGAWKTTAQ
jgi:hypothetical protein